MKKEKSCGFILLNNKFEAVLLKHRSGNHIDFCKGHIQKNETELQCALREAYEECHVQVEVIEGFRTVSEYKIDESRFKQNIWFLGKIGDQEIKIQTAEIESYEIVPLQQVLSRLTYASAKSVCQQAIEFLNKICLLVVDCQYDFIDGSLACQNAHPAIAVIEEVIHRNQDKIRVFYSADAHPSNHCSFKVNGGIWPIHCIKGTKGFEVDSRLNPTEYNLFLKGENPDLEEYSAFNAKNKFGQSLISQLSPKIVVCGIASEYCVMESVKALLNAGYQVSLLKDGLAYVSEDTHIQACQEYQKMGVSWETL